MSFSETRRPRIIAFSGPKTCGKDTAASILFKQNDAKTQYKKFFLKTPFAEGVKNICADVFGYSQQVMVDSELKERPTADWPHLEPRWPMMDIANWMRDKYGSDVWVRRLDRLILHAELSQEPYWAYVVTDWRFPEETDWLQKMGALKIYIERPEAEAKLEAAKAAGDAKALNPSEAHYASTKEAADLIIRNDAAIHNLQNNVLMEVRSRYGFWSS